MNNYIFFKEKQQYNPRNRSEIEFDFQQLEEANCYYNTI